LKSKHFERIRFLIISAVIIALSLYAFSLHPPVGDISKALPQDKSAQILNDYNKFDSTKKLFVIVNGLDEVSKKRAIDIKSKLKKIDGVKSVFLDIEDIDKDSTNYLAKSWYYLSDFNSTRLSKVEIEKKIAKISNDMISGGIYEQLDTSDPLGIFTSPSIIQGSQKDGLMIISDVGYIITASIDIPTSDIESSKVLYNDVHNTLKSYGSQITIYSPNFYGVENSAFIKNDIEKITLLTILILVLVYLLLLRNKTLLIFSITTLFLSATISLVVLGLIYDNVSILVVAFGAGIATIAEDYLFMMYLNNNYKTGKFNKDVFWGFVATEIGLFALSFIDFPLMSQLAVFAFVSLLVSYLIFAFIFPRLKFYSEPQTKQSWIENIPKLQKINPYIIQLLSIGLLLYSVPKLEFDSNLRHLDYQNEKLLKTEKLLESSLGANKLPILIYADTIDGVIDTASKVRAIDADSYTVANIATSKQNAQKRAGEIKDYGFANLRDEIEKVAVKSGFRSGSFSEAYKMVETITPYKFDINKLSTFDIQIQKSGNKYMSVGYISKEKIPELSAIRNIEIVDAGGLLSSSATDTLKSFKTFMALAFIVLVSIVIFVTKRNSIYALNFILFPTSIIALYLSFSGSYNLMHLFTIFLLMIYGIDYGIYLSSKVTVSSLKAVIYSCITTFAGFGLLVLSDVSAVYSIGEVSIIGLLAIALLFFQKQTSKTDV
jgi:predicted exporter